jgi:hypothetical protein
MIEVLCYSILSAYESKHVIGYSNLKVWLEVITNYVEDYSFYVQCRYQL